MFYVELIVEVFMRSVVIKPLSSPGILAGGKCNAKWVGTYYAPAQSRKELGILWCGSICRWWLIVIGIGGKAWNSARELPEFDGFGGRVID